MAMSGYLVSYESFGSARPRGLREPCGELHRPDARNGHVRFDERGRETGGRFGVSTCARPRLYNTSTESGSTRGRAFPRSSRRTVHNEQPACGSFVAKQTASQPSNADDTAATAVYPVFCFFECFGVERSARSRNF